MKVTLDTARIAFEEAIGAFAQKLKLVGTKRYDDLRAEEHARAFAVAGAMKADLLADLHEAVRKAVVDGATLQDFRKDFRSIVERRGWAGWTGEGTRAGEAWRTRVTYQANTRKAYATGRYVQLTDPDMVAVRPWWRWKHSGLAHDPRPQHKAWDTAGLTLRWDDPFWRTYFPPRIPPDYGCSCRVVAVRAPRDGDQVEAPAGWEADADPGAGAPSQDVAADIRSFVQQKMAKLPPELARDLGEVVASYRLERAADAVSKAGPGLPAAQADSLVEFASAARDVADRKVVATIGAVKSAAKIQQATGFDLDGYRHVIDNYAVRHTLKRHGDTKAEAARGQIAITLDDFALLPQIVDEFDRVFSDGKNKVGRDVLVFTKKIGGVGYRYVAELRPGKKLAAADSLRKKNGAWEN